MRRIICQFIALFVNSVENALRKFGSISTNDLLTINTRNLFETTTKKEVVKYDDYLTRVLLGVIFENSCEFKHILFTVLHMFATLKSFELFQCNRERWWTYCLLNKNIAGYFKKEMSRALSIRGHTFSILTHHRNVTLFIL